jgi:Zn ribbon nucleic-acid-binding protein
MRTSDQETIQLNGQDTFHGVNCIHCGTNNRGLLGSLPPDEAAAHWNERVAANAAR